MSGAHLPICKKLLEMMKSEGIEDIPVTVGGVIPKQDIPKLNEMGINSVIAPPNNLTDLFRSLDFETKNEFGQGFSLNCW